MALAEDGADRLAVFIADGAAGMRMRDIERTDEASLRALNASERRCQRHQGAAVPEIKATMRTAIRTVLACMLLLGLWGCGASGSPGAAPTAKKTIHMSWANGADTVAGMSANSDAVAVMTVTSIAGTGRDQDAGGGVPYTLFNVAVKRWLKGTAGDQITIKQSGDANTQVEDDPLLQVGETAVVFLHQFADGQYYIVAGPTGRLHLDPQKNLVPMPNGSLKDTGALSGLATALNG